MVFGVDLFRHYKPDPETYLGAAALFGCAPNEAMMVAAHPSDLAGAARYGRRTCHVSRPLEYGEGRIVGPAPAAGTFDLWSAASTNWRLTLGLSGEGREWGGFFVLTNINDF